jgi:hypothetical protein
MGSIEPSPRRSRSWKTWQSSTCRCERAPGRNLTVWRGPTRADDCAPGGAAGWLQSAAEPASTLPPSAVPQANTFTGTLPPQLCHPGSQLRVLNVRSNKLYGSAEQVKQCRYLQVLNLGDNNFTGPLPATVRGRDTGGPRPLPARRACTQVTGHRSHALTRPSPPALPAPPRSGGTAWCR